MKPDAKAGLTSAYLDSIRQVSRYGGKLSPKISARVRRTRIRDAIVAFRAVIAGVLAARHGLAPSGKFKTKLKLKDSVSPWYYLQRLACWCLHVCLTQGSSGLGPLKSCLGELRVRALNNGSGSKIRMPGICSQLEGLLLSLNLANASELIAVSFAGRALPEGTLKQCVAAEKQHRED